MLEDEMIHFWDKCKKNICPGNHIFLHFPDSENSSRSSEYITVLYYVLYEPCLPTSFTGNLNCQILITYSTLTTMIINITMLLMRIRVTGTMNDHNNGLAIKPLLPWVASQQLWRERNDFSKLRKVYKLFSMLFTLLTLTRLKDLLKVNIPLPYTYWRWFSRIQLTRKMKCIDSAKFLCETVWSSGKKLDFWVRQS